MYNVKVKHYLNESTVSIYSNAICCPGEAVHCDDYGVILERKPWTPPTEFVENPFSGEWERMVDLEEMERQVADRKIESVRSSLSRTLTAIADLSRSNAWEWFATFTFDEKMVDRYDYSAVTKALSTWLSNIRRKCPDLRYLVVPELHKDGAYHFHGLLANCDGLGLVYSGVIQNRKKVYNISSFRLGFTNVQRVADTNRVSVYVTKYITKDLCELTPGKKRYWCSRNLARPVVELYSIGGKELQNLRLNCASHAKHHSVSEGPYQDVQRFEMDTAAITPDLLKGGVA